MIFSHECEPSPIEIFFLHAARLKVYCLTVMHLSMLRRRGGGGAGRAWGGDLIVFVGNGVGHLTDLVLPGEGIFESFFARCGDI